MSDTEDMNHNREDTLMIRLFPLLLCLGFSATATAQGSFVTYEVNGETYEGFYINPSEEAPMVLLLHDWDGLTEYEIKRSVMLADLGYAVFAADLFGKGVRPTAVEDKKQHTGELYKDRAKMRALMEGARDKAWDIGGNRETVAMGYCFGGAAVLELARSGAELQGFATFHGGLGTPEGQGYENVKAPLLVMHGSADRMISMEDFANLAKALEADKAPHEMITYGGARHAFTVFGIERYNEQADTESWARFTRFLKTQLGPEPPGLLPHQ